MANNNRETRLKDEIAALQELESQSTIFKFTAKNDPPTEFKIQFHGKGISRTNSHDSPVEFVEQHECEIRIPYSYPKRPPDIRWRTPIYHPNVSYSGLVRLQDIGLPWNSDIGLDVISERLWDVARLAFSDSEKACNTAAQRWLETQTDTPLPSDDRPLRDKSAPAGSNVIRYERRDEAGIALPTSQAADDVLYIDEDTPVPDVPQPSRPVRNDDDDTIYIGYD